jgi:hypothetical protein
MLTYFTSRKPVSAPNASQVPKCSFFIGSLKSSGYAAIIYKRGYYEEWRVTDREFRKESVFWSGSPCLWHVNSCKLQMYL